MAPCLGIYSNLICSQRHVAWKSTPIQFAIRKMIMKLYCLFFVLSYGTGFVIERRKGADICDTETCSTLQPICSSLLEGDSIDCYSCGDIIKGHFSGKCIPHIIRNNVELFALLPLLTLEFDINDRKWNNYTSFKKDFKGRIILDPHGRSGKAYLLVTSRVIVALRFIGVDRTFPVTTITTISSAQSSTHPPTITTITLSTNPTTSSSSTNILTSSQHPSTVISGTQTHPPTITVMSTSSSTAPPTTLTSTAGRSFKTSTVRSSPSPPTTFLINITDIPPTVISSKTSVGLTVGLVFTGVIVLAFLLVLCYFLFKRLNIARYILPHQAVPDDTISMSTINTLPDAEDTNV